MVTSFEGQHKAFNLRKSRNLTTVLRKSHGLGLSYNALRRSNIRHLCRF